MINRKIPATMVSQHPDHAGKPYWLDEEFISTYDETKECFLSFSDFGVSEYKWDWEGKLVDESVIERLFSENYEFFKVKPLGYEKFLTFRLPNPKVETEFRLGRAFMGILSACALAKQVNLHTPPLFEVILPMTETAEEIIDIQEAFSELHALKHKLFGFVNGDLKHIEVIPLFEQAEIISRSDEIIKSYLILHKKRFGFTPAYLRPYIARSDPALNSGIVPTILALKLALSRYIKLENTSGVKLFPIVGTGSLPFRGGLTPEKIDNFLKEYKGIKTALLQSAFRYDYNKTQVIKAINKLEENLQKSDAIYIPKKDEENIRSVMNIFESFYKSTIEGIAPIVNKVAINLPKRRERVQHIGLFGYSRGIEGVRLPRAIGFTGALYSIGVPPEFIGTGRGISAVSKMESLPVVEKYYLNLTDDLKRAGRFLNKKVLRELAKKNSAWKMILEDVKEIEKYLGYEFTPLTNDDLLYQKLSIKIYNKIIGNENAGEEITKAAMLRKSMG